MDPITLQKFQSVIDSTPLTEFDRMLLDYFFFDDRSRPSLIEFRRVTNLSLSNYELQSEIRRVLDILRGSLAANRIERFSDMM